LFVAVFWTYRLPTRLFVTDGVMVTVLALLFLTTIGYLLKLFSGTLPMLMQGALFASFLALFAWMAWNNLLDSSEREVAFSVFRFRRSSADRP